MSRLVVRVTQKELYTYQSNGSKLHISKKIIYKLVQLMSDTTTYVEKHWIFRIPAVNFEVSLLSQLFVKGGHLTRAHLR